VCVASTTEQTKESLDPAGDDYFKSVQWSPDGTTLLANSADHHIRSYIL
jgi:WD40 repeat protein